MPPVNFVEPPAKAGLSLTKLVQLLAKVSCSPAKIGFAPAKTSYPPAKKQVYRQRKQVYHQQNSIVYQRYAIFTSENNFVLASQLFIPDKPSLYLAIKLLAAL
jgi:hypothetical protein